MKKIPVVSPVLFWACFFLFGLTLCQTTPVAAAGGYRIHYRHCSIETATNRSISVVSSTGRHSSVRSSMSGVFRHGWSSTGRGFR